MTIQTIAATGAAAAGQAARVPASVPRGVPGEAAVVSSAPGAASAEPDPEGVRRAVEAINRRLQTVAKHLHFSIDSETGKTVVRVLDSETQEVIRQIPSEEALAISRAMDKLQGLLIEQAG